MFSAISLSFSLCFFASLPKFFVFHGLERLVRMVGMFRLDTCKFRLDRLEVDRAGTDIDRKLTGS